VYRFGHWLPDATHHPGQDGRHFVQSPDPSARSISKRPGAGNLLPGKKVGKVQDHG